MTTNIRIVIRFFDHQTARVLYTVLRSPHIDKKSREQFEMEIKKKYLVIKT